MRPIRFGLLALFTVLPIVAACSSGNDAPPPTLQPPPESGQVAIDMDGYWIVDAIARIDSAEPVPGPDPLALTFLSIQEGQVVSISGGRAYDVTQNQLLYSVWNPAVPNDRYENVADGRFWRFVFEFFDAPDCVTDVAIQAAFGTRDQDTLDGFVAVRYLSSCPAPAVVRPNPNGTFAVVLKRVMPAALGR
ncbi:MAG: hypothetical protein JNK15_06610 [Planctomycetes bacterium]|nr:hypothetical protein [Planctomycetota bacterium]